MWAGRRFCMTTLDSWPGDEVVIGFAAWREGQGWMGVLTDLFDEQDLR